MRGILRRHGRNAGFALWDQGAFSAANFAFNVLLARWLDGAAYGAVTLVLSLNLAVLAFYSPFFLESASVVGPARYGHLLPFYGRALIALHGRLAGGFALLCVLVGSALSDALQRSAIWMFAGSAPFVLLVWLARRLPYVMGVPIKAATVSTLYAVLLFLGTFAARGFDALSTIGAVAIVALASAGAAVGPFLSGFREPARQNRPAIAGFMAGVIREHWRYSRWLLVAALLALPTSLLQTVLASTFLSVEAVGILRAVTNFTVPANLLLTAVSGFALNIIVHDVAAGDRGAAWRKARRLTVLLTGFCALYYVSISALAPTLDALIYAGRYQQHIWLVSILGLTPVLSAATIGGALLLRAIEQPQFMLIYAALSGPASLATGALLMTRYGLEGAALSTVVAPLIAVVVIYRRAFAHRRAGTPPTVDQAPRAYAGVPAEASAP